MLEQVTQLLATFKTPGAFATRRAGAAEHLRIAVKGVGPVAFPISPAVARRLCASARPARYGLRARTILDEQVRDCWEIAGSRIEIDQRRWMSTLLPQLERIQRDLGLPVGCTLKAELHNMLVYEPGQFFVAHQDSEKTDDMVGTLVVTLPSAFSGGAMVITHHDEKVTYRDAGDSLTFVAFYADCHHEVRPIKDGYRVVLTYNLLVEGEAKGLASPPVAPKQLDALVKGIREHFEAPLSPSWHGAPWREPADRLVYLLDHEYTQKGLGWHRLKNGDAARSAALRQAAERLNCEIFLALADVHETWSCEDDEDGYGRPGRRWRYDKADDDDPGSHTLVDLCDSDIELRHWVSLAGKHEDVSARVAAEEVCHTKASVDMQPFASEHEGYMGNYGNTVDRWYHRAAVVLWPRERTFVIRAKASAAWAIREISKTIAAREVDHARGMAERLLPFWASVARQEEKSGVVEHTLRVAAALEAPELAAALLHPFALVRLTPKAASLCAPLLERYGIAWCRDLFTHWAVRDASPARKEWVASLPAFCVSLCTGHAADALELARWITSEQWARLVKSFEEGRDRASPKVVAAELLSLSKPMLGLLGSSVIASDPGLQGEILGFLTSAEHGDLVPCLVHLLRTARSTQSPNALPGMGLGAVHQRCMRALTTRLNAPPRAKDDWSLSTPVRCACNLCQTLVPFLVAPDRTRIELPLAKQSRAHLHQLLDGHDLPVSHVTMRSGRPYTLVLTKTKALFDRDTADRKACNVDLDWLKKQEHHFFHRTSQRRLLATLARPLPR